MVKDGREWCLDVLDRFVVAGQSVNVGEAVVRRYRPVSTGHNHIVLGIFSSDSPDVQVRLYLVQRCNVVHELGFSFDLQFITDEGVEQCGSLSMSLESGGKENLQGAANDWGEPREIQERKNTEPIQCSLRFMSYS